MVTLTHPSSSTLTTPVSAWTQHRPHCFSCSQKLLAAATLFLLPSCATLVRLASSNRPKSRRRVYLCGVLQDLLGTSAAGSSRLPLADVLSQL